MLLASSLVLANHNYSQYTSYVAVLNDRGTYFKLYGLNLVEIKYLYLSI